MWIIFSARAVRRLDWFGDVHVKACLKGTQTVFASCESRQGYRRDRIHALASLAFQSTSLQVTIEFRRSKG
jgi:hypothetical protein